MTIDVKKLRDLLQAETSDYKWHAEDTVPTIPALGQTIVRFAPTPNGCGSALGEHWFQAASTGQAALICAAVNAAPDLLAVYEAACAYSKAAHEHPYGHGAIDRAADALLAAVDAARKAGT